MALLVPPPLDREVDGLRRALGDPALGRIPAHLTLVPPVNVREEDLEAALSLVAEAAGATRPFVAMLGPGATFFPDSPVVYLAVGAGAAEVESLRRRVLAGALERRITHPFVPHVTVCDEISVSLIEPALAALACFRTEVRFARVHLLEEGEGRVWSSLADYPFRGPAVIGRGGLPVSLSLSGRADPLVSARLDEWWADHQREEFGPEWSPPRSVVITARREGAVVGVAEGRVTGRTFWLDRLAVDPACRSQGIGTHLLSAVCSQAIDEGCLLVRSMVPAGARGASFLENRGFVVRRSLSDWRERRDFFELVRVLGKDSAS